MSEPKYSAKEIVQRGQAIYDQQIRSKVESEHRGEFLVLDILTGEYEIDPEDIIATKRLLARCPDAVIFGLRIGHRAAYRLGGFSKVKN
ncbi:MAG TPA: hypothetical protein VMM56_06715 [Planctomycetaceae bacterium]|nr:hypothetical protein [Planctomycetaceae bacterium]